MRKKSGDKKNDVKKQPIGPVFPKGDYIVGLRSSNLSRALFEEFKLNYLGKHGADTLEPRELDWSLDDESEPIDSTNSLSGEQRAALVQPVAESLLTGKLDIAVLSLRELPVTLPKGIILGACLRREDPRDAMVTRRTYGAIQELPQGARIGANSLNRSLQIRNLRPDIEIVPIQGNVEERLKALEDQGLDAVLVAWSSLRRLNLAPRYYVSLQAEHMTPPSCQGIVGMVCREEDQDLISKLNYIEDSEAAWAARCERAFLAKFGGHGNSPVGVFAHRKGTQDPWILDSVVGDPSIGEVLRHREIGTSRCKPESLADKAFAGIISKGARKFLPLMK